MSSTSSVCCSVLSSSIAEPLGRAESCPSAAALTSRCDAVRVGFMPADPTVFDCRGGIRQHRRIDIDAVDSARVVETTQQVTNDQPATAREINDPRRRLRSDEVDHRFTPVLEQPRHQLSVIGSGRPIEFSFTRHQPQHHPMVNPHTILSQDRVRCHSTLHTTTRKITRNMPRAPLDSAPEPAPRNYGIGSTCPVFGSRCVRQYTMPTGSRMVTHRDP